MSGMLIILLLYIFNPVCSWVSAGTTMGVPGMTTAADLTDYPPTDAVFQWPSNMIIRNNDERQIPFTFYPGASFLMANIKAVFVGESSVQTIFKATESSSNIEPGFENDFETVPSRRHDIKVKNMRNGLAGDYMASVTYNNLEEESRQFLITAIDAAECKHSSTADYVVEGEDVSLYCSVKYVGSLVPTIKWYDHLGNELDGEYIEDSTQASVKNRIYRHNFKAGLQHDDRQFLCQTTSVDDGGYSDECTTSFLVFSSAAHCKGNRIDVDVNSLNVLECDVVYSPLRPPLVTWYDQKLNELPAKSIDRDVPAIGDRPPLKERSNVVMSWDFTMSKYYCVAHFLDGLTHTCNVTTNVKSACDCWGETLSDIHCESPSVISILGAIDYTASTACQGSCPALRATCSDSVVAHSPNTIEDFKQACNGLQTCSMSMGRRYIPKCGENALSYYTEVYYTCETTT